MSTLSPILSSLNLSASVLSLFGSIWVMFYCLRSPKIYSAYMKIILAIGTCDFFFAISNIMSYFETPNQAVNFYCYIEAFVREGSLVPLMMWPAALSIICYKTLKYGRQFDQDAFFKKALLLIVSIVLLLNFMPFVPFVKEIVSYQKGPEYCLISHTNTSTKSLELVNIIVRMIYLEIPILSGAIICIGGYIKTVRRAKELLDNLYDSLDLNLYKLLICPVIQLLTLTPCMIDDLIRIFNKGDSPEFIEGLHLAVCHAIGIVNAFIYGWQIKSKDGHDRKKVSFTSSSIDELSVADELVKAGGC